MFVVLYATEEKGRIKPALDAGKLKDIIEKAAANEGIELLSEDAQFSAIRRGCAIVLQTKKA